MPYENLLVEKKDRIGRITINRPKKLNALNIETVVELSRAFAAMKEDSEVGVVVLTGSGEKSFAAGADIAELQKLDMQAGRGFAERGQALCTLIENLGKPVIAAINGFALGGGCELAMACTLRVAADTAKLGQPEINLGTIPGYGGTQRIARLVPRGVAMDLVLTGRIITATEALEIGLVNRVVPKEEFEQAVMELSTLLLGKPPFALKACIEAVLHGTEVTIDEGLRLEADLFAMTCATEDQKEGMKAFLEKRTAEFRGR
ncbi:MAG TPA: enoyl-CoA hydratase [Candidatus Eisenbacteria bacterium]|uniref:Enoyl-CoA hydratase n=1 Tax=Eiseniibacteriota bacterium TaxID=2212470 RepID=A0A7V2AVY6_UNCEI|nr:enoyl-CoA hydratase [Candidatus Eisenbacteria bacterium]